jgi:hypothetical protein
VDLLLILLVIVFIICGVSWFIMRYRGKSSHKNHEPSELTDMFYTEQLPNIEKLRNQGTFVINVSRKGKSVLSSNQVDAKNKADAITKATSMLIKEKVHYVKIEENNDKFISLHVPPFCLRDINNEIVHLTIASSDV